MRFHLNASLCKNGIEFTAISTLKWRRMAGRHEDMKYFFINLDNVNGNIVVGVSGVFQGHELMSRDVVIKFVIKF